MNIKKLVLLIINLFDYIDYDFIEQRNFSSLNTIHIQYSHAKRHCKDFSNANNENNKYDSNVDLSLVQYIELLFFLFFLCECVLN